MMRKIQHVLLILLIGIMVWGCAAAQLDSAKNQYEMALSAPVIRCHIIRRR